MKTKNLILHRSLGGAAFAGAVLLMAFSAPAQNLFVSNYANDDIYEITPGGVQSTFASGMNYPGGLAFNTAGDLFVANSADNGPGGSIVEITPGGTESAFATGIDPIPLAFNSSGGLFEGDYNSGNIYEFSPGGVRSTFATGLSFPLAMAFNNAGDLFVGAGYGVGNGYIEEITPGGTASTFASGLSFPGGLAFNSAGNLFATSTSSGTIYEYTPGGVQSTFASVNASGLNNLAFNSAGNLFVATGSSIVEITPGGTQSTFASGSGDVGVAFAPVPEPSVYALLGLGAAAIFTLCRRMRYKTIST
jgi:hypothetical protein